MKTFNVKLEKGFWETIVRINLPSEVIIKENVNHMEIMVNDPRLKSVLTDLIVPSVTGNGGSLVIDGPRLVLPTGWAFDLFEDRLEVAKLHQARFVVL